MSMKPQVTCHDRDWDEESVSPDKLKFRPSVYGLLIKDNKILLSRQWDGYDFPGGGVHIDETLEKALEREFWEETGLKIKVLDPIEATSSFFKYLSEKDEPTYWNCPMIYFFVEYVSGELSRDNFDEEEKEYADLAQWFDLAKLSGFRFYNGLGPKSVALAEKANKIIEAGKNY